MSIRIALAGNPNAGKTTLFNALTGSNQFVGNWPGVTVEKKEGKLKGHSDIIVTDLPGIYSLSPYTLEEVVARDYLLTERPDVILNIIDGSNLERNLYLTSQLLELGIPVVCAINMIDIVRKNGDKINLNELSDALGCPVVEISALKGTGISEATNKAIELATAGKVLLPKHRFSGLVEHAIAHIEEAFLHDIPEEQQRWYAIKIFESDEKVIEKLKIPEDVMAHIRKDIQAAEEEADDDAESIITNERYVFIGDVIKRSLKKANKGKLTSSDKIDRIVTNRWLGLPIFALIMFVVYYLSMVTVGQAATDWMNDGVFGDGFHLVGIGASEYEAAVEEGFEFADGTDKLDPEKYGVWIKGIPVAVGDMLDSVNCADWLKGLIVDGIIAGVGAVLGFVPQMLVLFLLLAFLEACGYMARIAFVLDRVFRRFGLSGKSFIPILVGTGCGVPGIMASRTIENERDRRMTIMTTTFIPCGAKIPFIALIAGAIFGGSAVISTGAYFIGIAAIIISGIILKKTKMFSGDPAPFVMELPAYHLPTIGNLLRSMWERGWSFIKKAGTIILLSTVLVWFASNYGFVDGAFVMLEDGQMEFSVLAAIGGAISFIFAPLGWGTWQATVASITGLVAKENIVGTLGVLYGSGEASVYVTMATAFTAVTGLSFLVFNLLCAPCFAAMGAIRREMNSRKWFWIAIGYECGFAYIVALMVNGFGKLFIGALSGVLDYVVLALSVMVLVGMLYMLFRPAKKAKMKVAVGAN